MPENCEIKAVHEKNLEEMLQSMELLVPLKDGKLYCRFCKKPITLKNFQCMYPKNDEIVFCCDDVKCFKQSLIDSEGEKSLG